MPRFRITISGQSDQAMIDLVRVHKLPISEHSIRREGAGFAVDAVAEPPQIQMLEAAGYRVERHEDVDEAAKKSLKQVGQGNRYKRSDPSQPRRS
jgi:hypothetical protein